MTSSLTKISYDSNICFMCDSFIFNDKYIPIEGTIGKIKLCTQLCFNKYSIMVEQRKLKSKPPKVEKKEIS